MNHSFSFINHYFSLLLKANQFFALTYFTDSSSCSIITPDLLSPANTPTIFLPAKSFKTIGVRLADLFLLPI